MPRSERKSSSSTPRPYLSWTQFSLFEKSPEAYIERYIYGKEFTSAALEFGKEVADGLEKEETDNAQIEHLRMFITDYSHKEYELESVFMGVPLLGRLDKFDDGRKKRIGEIKTGVVPWTQSKVDRHGQLLFYNLMLLAKTGKIADETYLYWTLTEYGEDGSLRLTGEIYPFKANITLPQVLLFGSRIPKVWEGIKRVTNQEYKNIV